MWDQLTPADFCRARHVLNLRRADTLKRHTKETAEVLLRQSEEIQLLDEKHTQMDALESLVEDFIRDRHLAVRAHEKIDHL
jgi:hypothetical protein